MNDDRWGGEASNTDTLLWGNRRATQDDPEKGFLGATYLPVNSSINVLKNFTHSTLYHLPLSDF